MLELIDPLLKWLQENLFILIFGVLALLVGGYYLIRGTIHVGARWALNRRKKHGGSRTIKKPTSWLKLQPRRLFKAKSQLLESSEIREFYAPAKLYTEEREEGKQYFRTGWLSPYPSAVRVSFKDNKAATKGKHFKVREQVAQAARQVRVKPLPETVRVAGSRADHFEVVCNLDRHKRSDVQALRESIESATQADSVETFEKGRTTASESFLVHMVKLENILTTRKIGAEFFDQHPATKWSAFPMAIDEFEDVYSLPVIHTLIYGMTGSGKGSPINATIKQAIPFVKRGEAKLIGMDLKESELMPYEFTNLFEEITYNSTDAMEIIAELYEMLKKRKREKRAHLSFVKGSADLRRRLPATKETPMVLLIIDELLSLLLELHGKGAEGKAAMANLAKVMALGRSLGIYVIAATQVADKELLGRMRENFVNAVVLRNQSSVHMNEIFLGDGNIERGFDPRKIEQSTEANDYKTSGMGYVMGETGDPQMVRFAYMNDEDIATIVRENPNVDALAQLENGEVKNFEDSRDEEINEEIGNLSKPDYEDFKDSLNVFKLSAEDALNDLD